ncbi:MAG: CBS domain-containing protein [Methanomassiliicoccales archaeon]
MQGSPLSDTEASNALSAVRRIQIGRPLPEGELVYATPEQELRKVVPRMLKANLDEIPVISGKRVLGVLSLRQIVRKRNLPPAAKVEHLLVPHPSLSPESTPLELAKAIVNTGFRELPVTERERLIGIADRTLLVKLVSGIQELRHIPVSSIMTPVVHTLREEEYVDKAFELIRSTGVRSIPVVDEAGRMVSLLTLGDLAGIGVREKRSETFGELVGNAYPVEITVGSLASKDFLYVSPSEGTSKLFTLMKREGVDSVPVLENGRIVGIITKFDVAQLVASLDRGDTVLVQINGIQDDELREELFAEVGKSVKKIDRMSRPLSLYIHVHAYSSEFSKIKYSFSARLQTDDGLFVAKSFDWNPVNAIQDTMAKLERMVREQKERKLGRRKAGLHR